MTDTTVHTPASLRSLAAEFSGAAAKAETLEDELNAAKQGAITAKADFENALLAYAMQNDRGGKFAFQLDGGRVLVAQVGGDGVRTEIIPCLR